MNNFFQPDVSPAAMQELLELAPDVLCCFCKEGRFLYVSAAARAIWGYGPEELYGRNFLEVVVPEDHDLTRAAAAAIDAGGALIDFENRYACKGGGFKVMQWRTRRDPKSGAWYCLGRDVTQQRLQEQERLARETAAAQQEISRLILAAQEQEHNVIGKELHDNVNQLLTTAKLYIENSRYFPEQQEAFTQKSIALLVKAIGEIRSLSQQLVSPTTSDHGLEVALSELADHYLALNLFDLELRTELDEASLAAELKQSLYRIVQEQLNNVVKYARATEVQVVLLQRDGRLLLEVSDNGVGFDPAVQGRGLGLRNIRNRADAFQGRIRIETAPGKGCTVVAEFPVGR